MDRRHLIALLFLITQTSCASNCNLQGLEFSSDRRYSDLTTHEVLDEIGKDVTDRTLIISGEECYLVIVMYEFPDNSVVLLDVDLHAFIEGEESYECTIEYGSTALYKWAEDNLYRGVVRDVTHIKERTYCTGTGSGFFCIVSEDGEKRCEQEEYSRDAYLNMKPDEYLLNPLLIIE